MGWHLVKSSKPSQIESNFLSQFGIDLEAILIQFDLSIWEKNNTLYLFPDRYSIFFSGLPVQAMGMVLAEKVGQGHFPTHEFCARFFNRFKLGIQTLDQADVKTWLAGNDLQSTFRPAESDCILFRMHQVGSLEEAG